MIFTAPKSARFSFFRDELISHLYHLIGSKLCPIDDKEELIQIFTLWAGLQGTLDKWKEFGSETLVSYDPDIKLGWKVKSFKQLGELLYDYYTTPWYVLSKYSIRDSELPRPVSVKEYYGWAGRKAVSQFGDHEELELIVSGRSADHGIIELEESSWVGVSIGAIHIYGKLKLPYLSWTPAHGPEHNKRTTNGGPSTCNVIELTMELTKKDIKVFQDEFKTYKPGNRYPGFFSQDKMKARAIDVCKTAFPGFKLMFEDTLIVP